MFEPIHVFLPGKTVITARATHRREWELYLSRAIEDAQAAEGDTGVGLELDADHCQSGTDTVSPNWRRYGNHKRVGVARSAAKRHSFISVHTHDIRPVDMACCIPNTIHLMSCCMR